MPRSCSHRSRARTPVTHRNACREGRAGRMVVCGGRRRVVNQRAFNPQGGLRGRTNSAGDLATTSTSGGGGVQAGTVDWVIFRRRTGVSPYRHSSQQYTASRAPSEHVGAIMNRVTSYLACRVQCATERAIGSPSEATRAKNGHIPAPCSDPNGRSGPCLSPSSP